ncbi:NAD(P)H-dependent glycerol-3-phosphate dehydrogenase [Mycoplasmopsis felis]|uniref:NAD(P)H-dependent glycerol-3-phosphate dehydrogenase n=1 Tax=Mycoplasmopsis felis TaxID=33923 RepID=UPI0021AF83D3|nr:NAD(P)H-dependent glycerol-3-phosphate dehydrogenase [Mycoplasmopsis felis]UWV84356.1 NAD(P)-binding domain-containing protein [Mycoplasmopsis felis]UWW00966.1 NAD(P)-binding domain-containing protein [Mycoplasmopsis felis]
MREISKKYKFGFIGTGSYGSALANVLSENGHNVALYGINEYEINDINTGYNQRYFGSIPFYKKENIYATDNLEEVVLSSEHIVLAIPSTAMRETLKKIKEILNSKKINIINLSKGIEYQSGMFFSDFIKWKFNKNIKNLATLTGPSFASEVFQRENTIINVVSENEEYNELLVSLFTNKYFKLIPETNVLGSEIFGAIKNVLAIGIGMWNATNTSKNTLSALLTMGINEINHIYKHLSNKENVDFSLSYSRIGDVYLTCTSVKSRNFTLGIQIYENGVDKALENSGSTVEGYHTAKTLEKMIKEKEINNIPFLKSILDVLFNSKKPVNLLDFMNEL